MSFGSFDAQSSSHQSTSAEINMVPLIDVMLVLLVIFLITAPLITHSINVQLPQANAQAVDTQQESIEVTITADGEVFFADTLVEMETLADFLNQYRSQANELEVRIRADEAVNYGLVAETMSALKEAGLNKIGFVTQAKAEQS